MRTGLIITYTPDNKPALEFSGLYSDMAKRFAAIKAGDWPDKAVKAEPWDSESGRGIPAVKITKSNPIQKTMKTLKSVLPILALFAFAFGAQAQKVTLTTSLPIYQSTDSNLASPLVLDCRGQKSVALEWVIKHSGTATAAEGMQLRPSMDGVNAAGNELQMFVITPASGTTTRWMTNLTVNGYPYMMITYITNIDADTYSTNTISYWVKKNAP